MTKEENEKRLAHLKGIVLSLPEKPGSYQFYDEDHNIIYVGKAKNLKNRVSSYFHKEVDRYKTKVLVSKIFDISYTVVNTEEDALLLENGLIKKYNPRYNVLLKDGKTYPSICVTNELFPRIFKTRTINKRMGTYYGPYSHVPTMVALLELIAKTYKPRTCRFPITREGIEMGRYKACLEYHIHNCDAPCIGKQSWENYQENIKQAREILKGNTREVCKVLYEEMLKKAEELKFEEADTLKKRYLLLDNSGIKFVDISTGLVSDAPKEGDTIYAWVAPEYMMSMPPQVNSYVVLTNVPEKLHMPMYTDSIEGYEESDGKVKLKDTLNNAKWSIDNKVKPVLSSTGEEVEFSDIKKGDKVLVWSDNFMLTGESKEAPEINVSRVVILR